MLRKAWPTDGLQLGVSGFEAIAAKRVYVYHCVNRNHSVACVTTPKGSAARCAACVASPESNTVRVSVSASSIIRGATKAVMYSDVSAGLSSDLDRSRGYLKGHARVSLSTTNAIVEARLSRWQLLRGDWRARVGGAAARGCAHTDQSLTGTVHLFIPIRHRPRHSGCERCTGD